MFKLLKDKLKKWVTKVDTLQGTSTLQSTSTIQGTSTPGGTSEDSEIIEKPLKKEKDERKKFKEEKIAQRKAVKEEEKQKNQEKKAKKGKEKLNSKKKKEEKEEKLTEKKKKTLLSKSISEEKFKELFQELEIILLQNNVAYSAIESIETSLKEKIIGKEKKVSLEDSLKESIKELLIDAPDLIKQIKNKEQKPFVILFAGINGAGKTTTLAKVANLLKKNKFSLCVAACDTFRAASIEQLKVHTDKLQIPLISKDYGADPASVGFDAISYAKKHKIDVVLIDTAGRMNNRDSLMKEIAKICRVNNPDLKIFLGESITGNDATIQAKDFNETIDIDGIILSKADVDEKGGTAISVSKVTGKPIYYLGVGQGYDDLEKFDKNKLIEKMFE